MTALEKAIAIAVEAHAGQTDKAGAPYILHPLRLMLRMGNETEMMAAVLHDVVEDGAGWTLERLAEEGIPAAVIDAVDHLTKRPEDEKDYDGFIRRAATHPVARRVKLADLEDNMDLGRIENPAERDFARLAKYRAAYTTLESLNEASPTLSTEASAAEAKLRSRSGMAFALRSENGKSAAACSGAEGASRLRWLNWRFRPELTVRVLRWLSSGR